MGSQQRVASSFRYQSKGRNHAQRAMLSALALLVALILFSISTVAAYADDSVIENAPAETPATVIPASTELEPQAGELAEIVLEAEESGDLTITNRWGNFINIYQNDIPVTTVAASEACTMSVNSGDIIRVQEAVTSSFRTWQANINPFVKGVACKIISMPEMSSFTIDELGTHAGDNFFASFNYEGSLTSLPAGSFDTSGITTVENGFFSHFNCYGSLSSLPAGSFDISNITTVGNFFFFLFNSFGSFTSLPAGSFDISNITTIGNFFFSYFNASGDLTSLPAGSFDTSNITAVGGDFFSLFNSSGALTSLPTGSFDAAKVSIAGGNTFFGFDISGNLQFLPSSFKLPEAMSSAPTDYCTAMFYGSALTKGNEAVPLYFAFSASGAFVGTGISSIDPEAGDTVYVNGRFSLAEATIAPIANQSYTGSALKPALEVMFNGTVLVEGTDYTAVYTNNTNAGTATVTITGMGNYDEDLSASFTIVAAGSNDTIPQTGDANTPLLLWGALLSVLALGVLAGRSKRPC